MITLHRKHIFSETVLPDIEAIRDEALSIGTISGNCAFLEHYNVESEYDYKKTQISQNRVMLHAQIGYRSLERSQTAYSSIYNQLQDKHCNVDRYGICLDWSMGYPEEQRLKFSRGTGLILQHIEEYQALTESAPVAPHFGDFVMGMPAAMENTIAALHAGSTSIGNLGQFFTFRLPGWNDDQVIAEQTVKAILLCANQSRKILIHSNLDDGFAALFTDIACALGAVLLEQYIVDDLLGGNVSHCYGHTYSEPLARLAFQRGLASVSRTPGTMVYGNTTIYGDDLTMNYANLGSYLLVDALAQQTRPTGHALNPVPVTEAQRIPSIDEIIDAHLFANQLIKNAAGYAPLFDCESSESIADELVEGATRFKNNVISGLDAAGVDTNNALELLLALRRIGARRLEHEFAPGRSELDGPYEPIFEASALREINKNAQTVAENTEKTKVNKIIQFGHKVCVATTDVHEYGKLLVMKSLEELEVNTEDGGVCTDAEELIQTVIRTHCTAIAISTYNGVALSYFNELKDCMSIHDLLHIPVYIGGKLNQVDDINPTLDELPEEVSETLWTSGAIPCATVDELISDLANRS